MYVMRTNITLSIATVFILMAAVFMTATGVTAQQERTITLDTQDADIRSILTSLAKAHGINMILGDSVKGTVSISLKDVPPMEAIELILTANGFVMDKVVDVVIAGKEEEVRKFLPKTLKIVPLQHISAAEIAQTLTSIAAGQAQVLPIARINSILITGSESIVQQMEQVTKLLDVEIPAEPEVPMTTKIFPLKYAQASSLQQIISDLSSPEGKVNVDSTGNSIVVTDIPSALDRMEEVISQLDTETPYMLEKKAREEEEAKRKAEAAILPALRTRMFNLNHVEASVMMSVIEPMLSSRGRIQTFIRQEGMITPIRTVSVGGFTGQVASASGGGRATEGVKWSDLLIVTDEESILADMEDIIKKLDTKPPQVKIQARVVEISSNDAAELGIDWQAVHSPSGSSVESIYPIENRVHGVDFNLGTFSAEAFEDILVRIHALETRGKADIMFEPSVMTLDNEMAQMVVAEKLPILRTFETEFRATTGVEFINVGISLSVVPHITEDGYVIMDAMPQVDSVKGYTAGDSPQPIISSRVAHTRVRIKDGETFAISGLLKDEKTDTRSAIPILGRIPLLGRLFGSTNTNRAKTDLMIFITPIIFRDNS
jgi:general secretion pathway protein D